jgi:hypothetical protein
MTPVPTALSSPPSLALGWSSVFGAGIPLSVQSHRAGQAPLQLLTKSANAGDGRTFREPRHCERSACSQPALRSPAAQATLARFICVGTLVRLQGNQRKRCYNVHPRTQYLCKCCLADGASLAILILQSKREPRMSYFSRNDDAVQRGGKVAADIACALLLCAFSLVFFGLLGGVIAFVLLESALIGVDYLMPNPDDSGGAAIR